MRDQRHDFADEPTDRPISVSHLLHTLQRYSSVILLSLVAVLVGYAILAAAIYALAPAERITTIPFRLDFEGADRGEYPNGLKFSPTEVISAPVVLKAFKQNDLDKYTTFTEFSRSLVVLESNLEMERVVRDFQARLSDPKLTPVDRDRIQREYESRLQSVKKGQFALSYMRSSRLKEIPEALVRKALNDILREWANFVANEQHVLEYRIAVISPSVINESAGEASNPVIRVAMLRAKVMRVLANAELIRRLPGAELARTQRDNISLNDITIRLDDIIRFRLEPLVQRAAAAGLDDRAETIRFLETQLAFDERRLAAQESVAASSEETLRLYTGSRARTEGAGPAGEPAGAAEVRTPAAATGGVMPQLTDSFLDRLVQLTSNAVDTQYRQELADQYRRAAILLVPLQEAVAYDRAMLDFVRRPIAGSSVTPAEIAQQINITRAEVTQIVQQMNAIYKDVSSNLNPTTELLTFTGVPTSRVTRAVNLKKLALYGILLFLVALPVIIVLCLLHNRVREEEAEDEALTRSDALGTTA